MKPAILDAGLKKIEDNYHFTFGLEIKYEIFAEMKSITEEEWGRICKEVNKGQFRPKIADFITAKKEIAKPIYNDDGKNYPARCKICDGIFAVKYEPGIEDRYTCQRCRENEYQEEEEEFAGREE